MVLSSGIVLPGEQNLTLRQIAPGLYVAVNAYECDAGYFSQSPLYVTEAPATSSDSQSETSNPLARIILMNNSLATPAIQ